MTREGATPVSAATSISTELAPLADLRAQMSVHSAFERAVNLRFEGQAPLSLPLGMVTVGTVEVGNLPNGILISSGTMALHDLARQGQRVWLAGGRLQLEGVEVDLRGARLWDASLQVVRAREWDADWGRRWAEAWGQLHRSSQKDESPLWGAAGGKVRRLIYALRHRALGPATRAAEELVGLGPGLTPSGDDLLMGILIGLQSHSASEGRQRFLADWGDDIRRLAHRTSDMGRVYLEWAVRGRATQRFRDVVEIICCPRADKELSHVVDLALRVGHTSGADGLLGLLLGLWLLEHGSEIDHGDAAQGTTQPVSGFGDIDAVVQYAGSDEGGEPGIRLYGDASESRPPARFRGLD